MCSGAPARPLVDVINSKARLHKAMAKAMLAGSLGIAEEEIKRYLGGAN